MTRRRSAVRTLAAALLLGGLVATGTGAGPAQAAGSTPVPARLAHVGDATQVIVVTAPGWTSSRATLRAYQKGRDGRWRQVLRTSARIGARGFAPAATRLQNSFTTPAGTFGFTAAFGGRADPGSRLPYRQVDGDDYWVYDPLDAATYNTLQPTRPADARWRTSEAERLADWGAGQYRYAAVIDYNLPGPGSGADVTRGGGIFLHVQGRGATAGCVAVSPSSMVRLLRWMDPAQHPRIVMGPAAVIGQM